MALVTKTLSFTAKIFMLILALGCFIFAFSLKHSARVSNSLPDSASIVSQS